LEQRPAAASAPSSAWSRAPAASPAAAIGGSNLAGSTAFIRTDAWKLETSMAQKPPLRHKKSGLASAKSSGLRSLARPASRILERPSLWCAHAPIAGGMARPGNHSRRWKTRGTWPWRS
jgi:hypothetical protein